MVLLVILQQTAQRSNATDKYGKPCLQTEWHVGGASFVQKSRYDIGRLVANGRTLAVSKGTGSSTTNNTAKTFCRFKDTERNKSVLRKYNVPFQVVADYYTP